MQRLCTYNCVHVNDRNVCDVWYAHVKWRWVAVSTCILALYLLKPLKWKSFFYAVMEAYGPASSKWFVVVILRSRVICDVVPNSFLDHNGIQLPESLNSFAALLRSNGWRQLVQLPGTCISTSIMWSSRKAVISSIFRPLNASKRA